MEALIEELAESSYFPVPAHVLEHHPPAAVRWQSCR